MKETGSNLPVPAFERLLVRGLKRDPEALEELLSPQREAAVLGHRLGPALALRGRALGLAAAQGGAWARELRAAAGRKLLLEHHLAVLGERLGSAGVRWLPLKGFDLGSRAYDRPEERPASDIDILIEGEALAKARRTLESAGWTSRASGPRFERFLEHEAYCWQAYREDGAELEVHFRFWGMIPPGYPAAVFQHAARDPSLGTTAWRCHPADAYLLAAVHVWMDSPPRPLLGWWDLERIAGLAGGDGLAEGVLARALRWGLQLPLLLAAGHAASLWPGGAHAAIAAALPQHLRKAERAVFERARRQGTDEVRLGPLTLARLVARRPSRSGLKAVWRRFWPHPGVVERGTPPSLPWAARRCLYMARKQGWTSAARWLESRFGGV